MHTEVLVRILLCVVSCVMCVHVRVLLCARICVYISVCCVCIHECVMCVCALGVHACVRILQTECEAVNYICNNMERRYATKLGRRHKCISRMHHHPEPARQHAAKQTAS